MTPVKNSAHQVYDVVVIGGGAVGENVADRAVQGGLSAVIIESELVGGACSYWACMPSKALLRPGAALAAARAAPGAGEVPANIDVPATLASRDNFAAHWDDAGQVDWLDSAGIDLIRGTAHITGERQVQVKPAVVPPAAPSSAPDAITVAARTAIAICTGSESVIPPIDGLMAARPWTSSEATAATEIPSDLLIIGGGVVGCEMATAFSDLGSRVHLIVRDEQLLSGTEKFAGEAVADSLRAMGVDVRLKSEVTSCSSAQEAPNLIADDATSLNPNRTRAVLSDGAVIETDQILVATGRRPHLPDISGVELPRDDQGTLAIDDNLRVQGADWLYLVGDVSGHGHTTHQGKYQARIIGDLLVANAREPGANSQADLRADDMGAPQVIFTRPEVAQVGLTAAHAKERGREVRVFDQDLGSIAGAALHAHNYQGKARFIVDEQQQVLVGATFVGQDVAEMLQAATTAIIGEVPLSRLWHVVPAYPTMSEVWLRFLEDAGL